MRKTLTFFKQKSKLACNFPCKTNYVTTKSTPNRSLRFKSGWHWIDGRDIA
jgi:hypothetical protein